MGFLIQACRGTTPDMGTDQVDAPNPIKVSNGVRCDDGSLVSRATAGRVSLRNKLPVNSDYFVGYGTVEGFAAMRNTSNGSWFIQAFVRVLSRHAHDKHFLELMTDVNRIVMKREGNNPFGNYHRCKAMSESRNTFSKLLYFFPGI